MNNDYFYLVFVNSADKVEQFRFSYLDWLIFMLDFIYPPDFLLDPFFSNKLKSIFSRLKNKKPVNVFNY